MPTLRIDFQEGFTNDAVTIKVNGQESLRKEGVTTRRMLGLATSSEIEVPEGAIHLEIEVPTQNISGKISLQATDSNYVGVSVRDGEIEHIASKKPFGYA